MQPEEILTRKTKNKKQKTKKKGKMESYFQKIFIV
jgi:hypothetical protein